MLQKTRRPTARGTRQAPDVRCRFATVNDAENNLSQSSRQALTLRHGRAGKIILQIVPDSGSSLYRIAWPDIGLSPSANLPRCKDAALRWAEQTALTDDRKNTAARRLRSLNNFSWSSSPVRYLEQAGTRNRASRRISNDLSRSPHA